MVGDKYGFLLFLTFTAILSSLLASLVIIASRKYVQCR
jgi:hypothetical protein